MSKNVTVNIHIQKVTVCQAAADESAAFPLPPLSTLHVVDFIRERAAQAAAQVEADTLDASEVEASDKANVTRYPKAVA